ncbi:MAG TPA: alpha-glucosidase [Salinibacter sp.]|nr:alpha-glucosidase [Salinibacter sp.]
MTLAHTDERRWWKEAVVYQVYPRSFNDTTGSGSGDLPGITEKLDYLADLGVDVVWLSPVYDSPMNDNGYDIRDYRAIADLFGTMADFDAMLAGMHERGIRLMMDLVVNHTSSEHVWFQQSRQSKDNPYRDYYHWHPPAEDGGPPTNWRAFFGGSAWTFDEATGEYYLHLFDETQPDLNWTTPAVRAEVYDLMRFWLEKGVDGFRMDVIPFISKPPFEDVSDPETYNLHRFYANGPRVHEYLQEMHQRVLATYDVMTVGEGQGIKPEEALLYAGADRDELQSFFYFDHVQVGRAEDDWNRPVDWTLPEFKAAITEWDHAFGERAWPSVFLGNHDFPRAVSIFGDDRPDYRERSAKMLATLLLTLRGTPYIYQGDEIGMTNALFETLDDFEDLNTINDVYEKVAAGEDRETVLDQHRRISRDHARTPMQWDASEHAGFTDGTPWLMVNPNHDVINVDRAWEKPDSIFHYYRRLIELRRERDVLVYGRYELLLPDHPAVFVYRRILGNEEAMVSLNFTTKKQKMPVPDKLEDAVFTHVLGNYEQAPPMTDPLLLRPYEGRVDGRIDQEDGNRAAE